MSAFDDRIVKVSFEIRGQLKTYDGLYIAASGTKYANANQNEAEIKIANMAKIDRDYLVTETSPYNSNRTPKKVYIEAGRVSTGTVKVFAGDIITATPSQPPDIMLTIKAKTGGFAKGNIVSVTAPNLQTTKQLARSISDNIKANLQFEADDKQIANHSYAGDQYGQISDLGEVGGVNAYLDDDTLVVKNQNQPLSNRVTKLSIDTGMIGIPEFTEKGIKVKFLFDNSTVLGGALEISSILNPAANGTYTIFKLSFDISNRDNQFYWIAEAVRPGITLPPKPKSSKKK